MLAPLLFVWPISIAITYHIASSISDVPYDRALAENVRAISRLVRVGEDKVGIRAPNPARALLHPDEKDTVYYQVLGKRGELVAGDRDIPWVEPPADVHPDVVHFRDADIYGEDVRVAWLYLADRARPGERLAVVQVAETRKKRTDLSNDIVAGVILPQFAIIPLAVILVYMGLGRGIAPLNRLAERIQRRLPGDLSPVSTRRLPEEMVPVIDAFNDMMARLEENLHGQQRFIANAAHQMRTPLTGLKMQADLAIDETDPEHLRDAVRRIALGADRAAHLINQLLSLARAEASYEKVHGFETLDLDALLREVAGDMAQRALARRIDFGFEPAPGPVLIDGSPVLLRELIKNLVDNAIKYTPPGGKVTTRVCAGHEAVLEVEDSGIGIAEADRELVFERFYRVLGSGAEGSGLGLAIVREIAELHRARVALKPNPSGQGTVAEVSFPRVSPPAALPPPAGSAPPLA
ncbi:MAG: sensor histidine kinase N-terminal domain-containing protein [Betaproteobacteria bacterium]|nr:sensor histidine kinase N-terminal domain-containing protein [Betaproteobacteria bacterium]